MSRLRQAIRRHRETTRTERELARAYRGAASSDLRAELANLPQWTR